jgi:hypothetical protein
VAQDAVPASVQVLRGSGAPAATFTHRPSDPVTPQLRHGPAQADSQHTPSTHWPELQSAAAPQVCPFDFRPLQVPVDTPFTVASTHGWPVRQSASDAQVRLHIPFTQRAGEQSTISAARQDPRPSQVGVALCRTSVAQAAAPHRVLAGNLAHAPSPSHRPVVAQVEGELATQKSGSGTPAPSSMQEPSWPTWLQDMHSPAQATLQQTPSTQLPDAQRSAVWHGCPLRDLPQAPPRHCCPAAQSELVVHASAHRLVVGSQVYGKHGAGGAGAQVPLPSQEDPPATESPAHAPSWQGVAGRYRRQAPRPSHFPSVPQLSGSEIGQAVARLGFRPAGTGRHSPRLSGKPHDMQVSWQADAQQTPSVQNPL